MEFLLSQDLILRDDNIILLNQVYQVQPEHIIEVKLLKHILKVF